MTDLELQHVIVEEIRTMCREESLYKLNPTNKEYGGPSWYDEDGDWGKEIFAGRRNDSCTGATSDGTKNDSTGTAESDSSVWTEYEVYTQDKPYKDDTEDEAQEDYIIVMIGDEDTDEDGRWVVEIQILIGLTLYDPMNQGNQILANLMNQIHMRFQKKGWLDGKYELEPEAHKRFNQMCVPPEYEAALITKWKLPEIKREGIGEFL